MVHEFDQQDEVVGVRFRSQFLPEIFHFDFHVWTDGLIGDGFGVSRCLFLSILFWGMMGILSIQIVNLPLFTLQWLIGTAPIWAPLMGIAVAWKVWMWYIQGQFLAKRKTVLLEVKFPRDLVRSPRAMDNALSKLWIDSGETTFFNTAWQGQHRPYFSLEMVSFGGEIHFYIWTWDNWRGVVEAMMYAYYPEVEIVEAEDYASKFRYDPDKHECFPTDWRYEPRNDAYPIKTYIEFELDKDPKEEYKIDPLAPMLEAMSNLRPDEQIWIQIIIQMSKDKRRKPGGKWWELEDRYTGIVKDEIDHIRKTESGGDDRNDWRKSSRIAVYRVQEQMRVLDRAFGKHVFRVGVRGVYISDPDKFGAGGYTRMRWIWRPVGNIQYLNQLRPRRWANPFDYAWQDWADIRWTLMIRRFMDAYRRRSYFYSPWIIPHNLMTTEVIATLWHPPSRAIVTPGLERIPAKKAEPPPNLPR